MSRNSPLADLPSGMRLYGLTANFTAFLITGACFFFFVSYFQCSNVDYAVKFVFPPPLMVEPGPLQVANSISGVNTWCEVVDSFSHGGSSGKCSIHDAPKPPQFQYVKVMGRGYHSADIDECTCFYVQAFSKDHVLVDLKCRQRAYFVVLIQSGQGSYLAASVQYLPQSSTHKVCYTIGEAGEYKVNILLEWTSYDTLTTAGDNGMNTIQHLLKTRNVVGDGVNSFHRFKNVGTGRVTVSPPVQPAVNSRAPLRPCSLGLLGVSGNQGYWVGTTWHPVACMPTRVTPQQLGRCLNQKSILFVGDSQLRYTFAELMAFLGDGSRDRHFRAMRDPKAFAKVEQKPGTKNGKNPSPFEAPNVILRHTTKYGATLSATMFGNNANGFALARPNITDSHGASVGSFQVTYVNHPMANSPMFQPWMLDASIVGEGNLANSSAPFDFILAASGIHDDVHIYHGYQFGKSIETSMAPQLLKLVRKQSGITWASTWAQQSLLLKARHIATGSNPRKFVFNSWAQKVTHGLNISNWLDVWSMTMARPDLSLDGTHYSRPVTLAMLELWLGSICSSTAA